MSNYPAGVRDTDFGIPDDDICFLCNAHIDDCECETACMNCNGCRRGRPCELLDPACP